MTFPKKTFYQDFFEKNENFPEYPLTKGRHGAIIGAILFGGYDHDPNQRHVQYDERRDAAAVGAFFVVRRRIMKIRKRTV